jgi:hypothetical protein
MMNNYNFIALSPVRQLKKAEKNDMTAMDKENQKFVIQAVPQDDEAEIMHGHQKAKDQIGG